METFVASLHILVAFVLIVMVLVQDSKSGSMGGAFGGGGSNSVLGATGATTLAQQLTRWTAVIFAMTSITLTVFSTRSHKSILDSVAPVSASAPAAAAPTTEPAATAPATDAAAAPAKTEAPAATK